MKEMKEMMYLINPYILYTSLIFLCLILLTLMAYVLYMNDDLVEQLSHDATHRVKFKPPLLLSDWVYVNLDQDVAYLDKDRHLRTVGKGEKLRVVLDMFDRTGSVVNSAVTGKGQVTISVNGQQMCGTLIPKRGGYVYSANNQIRCKVDIARVTALRQTYDLTTDNSPLQVMGSNAHINRHP